MSFHPGREKMLSAPSSLTMPAPALTLANTIT
ncbi:MAG: hypothetical protein JWL81_50 [Verrucomicrobiales bacterium]|nr:hypothetical protein [Verrucomicrobiales bacterium]